LGEKLVLELDRTPDILSEVGQKKGDRFLVGFAAETENLIEYAKRKLETKNCDMVVANLVSAAGTGFESDDNEVTLVLRSGTALPIAKASKTEIARRILDEIVRIRK
jgi:phosphopantothenoylcysteine decarboxylase/phosphopantothenate--cysteine ligase